MMFAEVCKSLPSQRPCWICLCSERLKDDKEFMLNVLQQKPSSLMQISQRLIDDKEFMIDVLQQNGLILGYCTRELRKDKKFVLAAVHHSGEALKYASQELQNDEEVVSTALGFEGINRTEEIQLFLDYQSVLQTIGSMQKDIRQYASERLKQKFGFYKPNLFPI